MKRSTISLLASALLAMISPYANAGIVTQASLRGWVTNFNEQNGLSPTNNYFAGWDGTGRQYRDLYSFQIGASISSNHVVSASVILQQPTNGSNIFGNGYELHDFNGSHSTFTSAAPFTKFNAVGASYGTTTVSPGQPQVAINLGGAAINDLRSLGSGAFFDLIGRNQVQTAAQDFVFGSTGPGFQTLLDVEVNLNDAPVAISVDQAITHGNGVLLNASPSFDPDAAFGDLIVSYDWDIDNNGIFDFFSATPFLGLTATQLTSFGLGLGNNIIRLQATDTKGVSGFDLSLLQVNPAPPVAEVPEPATFAMWSLAMAAGGIPGLRRRIRGGQS